MDIQRPATRTGNLHVARVRHRSPAVKSYGIVRIYGVDCDQVANSLPSAINNGQNIQKYTVSAMVDALNWARGNLTNVHYTSPVGIADTVPAVIDNPAL